jgi:DNA-binding NtrC family response regulator
LGLGILIVDDDVRFTETLCRFLRKEGHEVASASTGAVGLRKFVEKDPELVLLDLFMPDMDGLQVLEQMKSAGGGATFIVMTAHGSVETAVQAIHLGAADYVTKPIDLESLCLRLEQLAKVASMKSDLGYLMDRERTQHQFEDFVGDCEQMREVYGKIRQVAKTDNTTVLITGESGTGKELVARAVHNLSARQSKPLIQVDCTAIPLALMESELFGHERGAFSGADRVKRGLLEVANNGTLLLDEIGDMDPSLQAKVLRVLEERQFRRVGSTRDRAYDVRIIAATNQRLEKLSKEGRFRPELLYRLKVFEIKVPPLRERDDDILILADAFTRKYARSFRKAVRGLDEEARWVLRRYTFPGNVRELRNIIEQAVILASGDVITRDLLPVPDRASVHPSLSTPSVPPLSIDALGEQPLVAAERELVRQALKKTGGNKQKSAQLLGISRFALQRKIDKYEAEA